LRLRRRAARGELLVGVGPAIIRGRWNCLQVCAALARRAVIVALVREVGALVVLRALGRTVRERDSRGPVHIALESDLVQVPGPPAFDTLLPIQQRDGGAFLVGGGRLSLGRLNCPQVCAALARRAVIVALVREVGALVVLRALGRAVRERNSRALESDFIAAIWGPAFDTLLPIDQREEARW
jgi:hypothetical protein